MILGWLLRVAVVLTVLAVLGIDGASLLTGRFQAETDAQAAATAAAGALRAGGDRASVVAAAQQTLTDPGERIAPATVQVGPGDLIRLAVQRQVHAWPLPASWTLLTVDGSGSPGPVS